MSYKLFIDDERMPPESWESEGYPDGGRVVIARSSQEAIDTMVRRGFPDLISFDHDLGGDDTTRPVVEWMINEVLDRALHYRDIDRVKYCIHSQNPVGRDWLISRMNDFEKALGLVRLGFVRKM